MRDANQTKNKTSKVTDIKKTTNIPPNQTRDRIVLDRLKRIMYLGILSCYVRYGGWKGPVCITACMHAIGQPQDHKSREDLFDEAL
jgi:hypothetical protein